MYFFVRQRVGANEIKKTPFGILYEYGKKIPSEYNFFPASA